MVSSTVLDRLGFTCGSDDIIYMKGNDEYIVRSAVHVGFDWSAIIMVRTDRRVIGLICEAAQFSFNDLASMLPARSISRKPSLVPTGINFSFQFGRAAFSGGFSIDTNKIGVIEARPLA